MINTLRIHHTGDMMIQIHHQNDTHVDLTGLGVKCRDKNRDYWKLSLLFLDEANHTQHTVVTSSDDRTMGSISAVKARIARIYDEIFPPTT